MSNILKKIFHMTIWFFELFTSAKSFQANPLIGSHLLNRLGLHVVRLVGAHLIMYLRMWMLSGSISVEDRKVFMRNGYLLKENFLADEALNVVKQEVSNFDGETREAQQGDTLTHRSVLEPRVLEAMPGIEAMFQGKVFRQLCSYTAGHIRPPLFYIESVKNQFIEAAQDPQKTFHSDTFHPTMKCWYFIDEVKAEQGPFTFIPGSHQLTWKRIKWEYQMSLKVKDMGNNLASNGSFRFTEQDLRELDVQEPISFTVKPNTLLFANTFGIHRRGDSKQKTTRTTIWGDSRTNPFIPFPGITSQWINEMQYKLLAEFRRRADDRAAKAGQRSPWQVIEKD